LASFNSPWGIAIDSYGTFFVADSGNNKVRKITDTGIVTTLAGTGEVGFANGDGTVATFDGVNGIGIAIDNSGVIYLAEDNNHRIRKIVCN
jgi:serine/threonine protein kinase, bacterial